MWDDDDVTLLTVPGWGDSGHAHWQSRWELGYPLARRAAGGAMGIVPARDAAI